MDQINPVDRLDRLEQLDQPDRLDQIEQMPRLAAAVDPRYSRQVSLPEIGPAGQLRLAASRVLVVGAGGLGSPLLFALAGAGVGHLTIVDHDRVSESNLNRQFLYRAADLGAAKAGAAAARLLEYHPDLSVAAIAEMLTEAVAPDLIRSHDLVVTAVDNRQSRLLVNQHCCRIGRPLVDGGINGLAGYAMVVEPGVTPCYHCLFGLGRQQAGKPLAGGLAADPAPGVLGAVAGMIGSLQATLAILLLLEQMNPLAGETLFINARNMSFNRLKLERDPDCPHCAGL